MAVSQPVLEHPFQTTEAPSAPGEQNLLNTIATKISGVLRSRRDTAQTSEDLVSTAVAEGMDVVQEQTDLTPAELRQISDKVADILKSITSSVAGGKGRLSLTAITTFVASTAALLVVTYSNDAKVGQLNLKLEQQKTTLNLQTVLDRMDSLEEHFINMLAKADLVQGRLDSSNLDELFADYDPQLDLLQLVISEDDLTINPRISENENELYKFLQSLAAKGEKANKPVASVRFVLQDINDKVDDIVVTIDRSTNPPTGMVKVSATDAVKAARLEILAGLARRALGLPVIENDVFYDPASGYIPPGASTVPRSVI